MRRRNESMNDCIFCMIASGKIPCTKIAENKDFLAFLDINPINPGHTLIIPKKHVENVFDLGKAEYAELFEMSRRISEPLRKAAEAKKIGVIVEGFLVPHAHVHLVPLNYAGELSFSRAKKADPAELAAMASRIRQQL
ncbi:MAG: HIT family protein [Candidatus Micrarchaeota archaeon]